MPKPKRNLKAAPSRRLLTASPVQEPEPPWTFLTNHAHVLLCVAREPAIRMRDIASLVGITERSVQRIIAELEEAGYLKRIHHGRQNSYEIRTDRPLRHPIERHERISSLIALVLGGRRRGHRG